MEPEVKKLEAVEMRLRSVIHTIVGRYRACGTPLTWRLMFEIEDEAISCLEDDANLDLHYLNMMASPTAQRRANTDEPAGLTDVYAMHTALWMIQEAYYRHVN